VWTGELYTRSATVPMAVLGLGNGTPGMIENWLDTPGETAVRPS
jgi:hypothetical protein